MLGVATAGAAADAVLKLWAVSELPSLRQTPTFLGVELLLVFNRRPSFDYEHFVIGQALLVLIKFVALACLGWRLKGRWRWLGLGLILGGTMANVGNWLLTHAVPDFLVMPWATVNLADLLIVMGAAVICAGWAARALTPLIQQGAELGGAWLGQAARSSGQILSTVTNRCDHGTPARHRPGQEVRR
jgi:lipoprotein signal peptidase